MKKIDITGWDKVFLFTFTQFIKSKSYIISLIVLCILGFVAIPVFGFLNKSNIDDFVDNKNDNSDLGQILEVDDISKIYFNYNKADSDVTILFDEWRKAISADIVYADDTDVNELRESLNDSEDKIIIKITNVEGVYSVEVISGWDTTKSYEDMDLITERVASDLKELQLNRVIASDAMPALEKEVNSYTMDDVDAKQDPAGMQKYFIWLGFITIATFITTIAGQAVANTIVTEKSSKIIEYLMLSIKPMAIVIGKVLASLASLAVQIVSISVSVAISLIITIQMLDIDVFALLQSYITIEEENYSVFAGANVFSIILALTIMLAGVLLFALIASIAGASVSKMEEMTEGMVLFTMLVIVGAYMSLALAMKNMTGDSIELNGLYAMVCCLMPLSAPFTVPMNLLTGAVPVSVGLIALGIILICIVIVLLITSKIYEYLLFYNGVTLKIKDILHIIRYGRVKEGK